MIIPIVDSFVSPAIKSSLTTGAGESKIHIGPRSDETAFDTYFSHFTGITCSFDQANLLEHIDRMIAILPEVAKIRKAKNELTSYYDNLKSEISAHTNFSFSLEKHIDTSRYYIRPLSTDANSEKLWNDFFRKIPIPDYSQLRIDKSGTNFSFLIES